MTTDRLAALRSLWDEYDWADLVTPMGEPGKALANALAVAQGVTVGLDVEAVFRDYECLSCQPSFTYDSEGRIVRTHEPDCWVAKAQDAIARAYAATPQPAPGGAS